MFLGNLLSSLLLMGIAELSGISLMDALSLSVESTINERNRVRVLQMMAHFFTFALPALVIARYVFKAQWPHETALKRSPSLELVIFGCLFIAAAFPLAQAVYEWNRNLPLPDWMTEMEDQSTDLIRNILIMERWDELLFNLLAVGVFPALGEELVFRGLVQRQLERLFGRHAQSSNQAGRILLSPSWSGHLAVWSSGILFSAIHLQFEGFFARLILGVSLGYLLLWTRNLWVPIIAHFFNNAGQVIIQFIYDPLQQESLVESEESLPLSVLLLSLPTLAVIGYALYRRRPTEPENQIDP